MSRLRPFQTTIKGAVFEHWQAGRRNVLVKSPTGSGKTVILSDIVKTVDRASAVIAHRSELVSQISLSLAREGVRHRIVGPDSLRRNCVSLQMDALGRSFFDAGARVGVCGVDTLVNRDAKADPWFSQVGLWVQDEAHHVLKSNKWGTAASMFPNAFGLGVTATPSRADGKGLGRENDGLFDGIVYGPEMRELIDAGYLTDYRVFAPPSDVDYSEVTVTATGDYSPAKLRAAVHASDKIVGDVVSHYRSVCMEKLGRLALGVTFAVDVENAKEIAAAFNADGIPAEVVSAKTPDLLRAQILRRFERREILQLVNVDLFGEGFDLPAIEVVSMVRKTESWPLFVQQFGRALRLMIAKELAARWGNMTNAERLHAIATSGKPFALIIDHVGNVIRHGLPDAPRLDTLDRRGTRSSSTSDAIPERVCTNPDRNHDGTNELCAKTYERFHKCCPHCGFYPEPAARTAPEFVDGDLHELDAATLAALRGRVMNIDDMPVVTPGPYAQANFKVAKHAQTAQFFLREVMKLWGGWQRALGLDDSQIMRKFYLTFGVDVLSAQALKQTDAEALTLRVKAQIDQHGVIAA